VTCRLQIAIKRPNTVYMYLNFYKFIEKPFNLTPDPDFFYMTPIHKRALSYLVYGLEDRKGFITVSGEVGAGKTTLIQTLLRRLDQKTIVSRVSNTQVSELQLLKMIIRDFGVTKKLELKEDIFEELNTFLLKQYSRGRNPVLIIDEAQNLSPSGLEEIRLISNLETEKDKLIQIILVGQPELRDTLSLPELKQLKQRITVSYHLAHLGQEDVGNYINHRLSVAGYQDEELFSQEAVDKIYTVTKGVPRLINVLCDAALLAGYVENSRHIKLDIIQQVVEDLDILEVEPDSKKLPAPEQKEPGEDIQSKLQTLSERVDYLYEKSLKESIWAKELREREKETYNFQMDLFARMEQIIELEKELDRRKRKIDLQEDTLGTSGDSD